MRNLVPLEAKVVGYKGSDWTIWSRFKIIVSGLILKNVDHPAALGAAA